MAAWTANTMPDQTGRVAVVTGASSGLGTATAAALAAKGAQVVLAVRDAGRGEATRAALLKRSPGAAVSVSLLDLADLASVRAFAARAADMLERIDILVNNAGLGLQPTRATTRDTFERQFGTNHLGHFALTGLLIPVLLRAPAPRVVAISSIAHRTARMNFGDLQGEKRYSGGQAYGQSKLANILFALELDRRARAAGSTLVSVVAHPGVSATGFLAATGFPPVQAALAIAGARLIGQSAERGALPGLYAATMPDVTGGQYWGPDGLLELRGAPAPATLSARARDPGAAATLWSVSETLTGVTYPPLA